MKFRRSMIVCLSVSLASCLLDTVPVAAEGSRTDYEGHWAQKQIESWIQHGWLKGFEDGSVKPDQEITRAEFITLANRMWGFTASKQTEFSDLPNNNWAYSEFAKAMTVGYIQGYKGKIRPNDLITRQEVAVIMSRLLFLEDGAPEEVLSTFSDYSRIASWSRPKVTSMVNIGAMKGYPDGSFGPERSMTRAESIALMEIFNFKIGGLGDIYR
ncbi:S-layer homology domain-containing protein [Paenibacillus sp. sgz5001063]|uniref:S-layer homology domain-containing protein n=1 Tax=Paenibacillus sp. sgz5001063 TaxID=3242474 RepID=UPI0036D4135F